MDVHLKRPFYINIANFCKVDANLPNHQKLYEVASAPQRILPRRRERFLYLFGAKANKIDSPVNAVHYKPTPDHLDQIAEHVTVKENDNKTKKKNQREDVQLPSRVRDHQPAFPEMLEEFKSILDRHLGLTDVANHCIDLLDYNVRPVHSAPQRGRAHGEKFCRGRTWPNDHLVNDFTDDCRMGGANCVCLQEERLTPHLCRLLKFKCHDHSRFVPPPSHGRNFRQIGGGDNVFNSEL